MAHGACPFDVEAARLSRAPDVLEVYEQDRRTEVVADRCAAHSGLKHADAASVGVHGTTVVEERVQSLARFHGHAVELRVILADKEHAHLVLELQQHLEVRRALAASAVHDRVGAHVRGATGDLVVWMPEWLTLAFMGNWVMHLMALDIFLTGPLLPFVAAVRCCCRL